MVVEVKALSKSTCPIVGSTEKIKSPLPSVAPVFPPLSRTENQIAHRKLAVARSDCGETLSIATDAADWDGLVRGISALCLPHETANAVTKRRIKPVTVECLTR
jgi:hypothetical protein